jgi:hypothetical protein
MPACSFHDLEGPNYEIVRDFFVEQIAHAIHENLSRLFPSKRER